MELRVPLESRLADLSLLDYYRLCVFRVWFWRGELLVLDRITEILRRRDVEKLMEWRTAAAAPRDGGIPAGSGRDIHVPLL